MESITETKSFAFAIDIVDQYKKLVESKKEFVLSKQLLRSGTAVGALMAEAQHGQSKPDFLSKVNIVLKEANETKYWLRLLHSTQYIETANYTPLIASVDELLRLLKSIVKTTKESLGRRTTSPRLHS